MDVAVLIARLLLALVFGVAGIAKAADLDASSRALTDFGLPEKLAIPLGRVLPFIEILTALALIPLASVWWGAIVSFALLVVFTAAIGINLVRGQTPNCRCFGQLHSKPVSWATCIRNLLLAAVAAFILAQGKESPGLSALDWLSDLRTPEAISLFFGISLIGLFTVAIIFLNRLLKQQTKLFGEIEAIKTALTEEGEMVPVVREDLLLPEEGLPVGARAPKFRLATTSGDEATLDDLLAYGKSVLLLFVSSNCSGCKILLPMVRIWEDEYGDRLTIAVLSQSALKEGEDKIANYDIGRILIDEKFKVADNYKAKWTPAAVLINADGRIASQVTYGDNAIRTMVRNLIASGQLQPVSSDEQGKNGHIPQTALRYSTRKIGEPVVRFSLPDLAGRTVNMEELLGTPTLLIFWHPLCKYCKSIYDDIRRLEENAPKGAPRMVFIASGDLEDIRTVNGDLKSLTLFDPELEVGPLFGTRHTPSAILIDETGRIASSLAIGDPSVRALMGLQKAEEPVSA